MNDRTHITHSTHTHRLRSGQSRSAFGSLRMLVERGKQPGNDSGGGGGDGEGGGNRSGNAAPPKMRRQFMTWILVMAVLAVVWTVLMGGSNRGEAIQTPQEFFVLAKEGYFEPASVVIEDDKLMATLSKSLPGATERSGQKGGMVWVRIIPGNYDWVREQLTASGVKWQEQVGQSMFVQLLLTLAPGLLILLVLWFLIARGMRNAAGGGPGGMLGSFGKSRHRVTNKENVQITFADVAGVDEAKEEVGEIVEFLKNPKRFSKLGGRIPRGVLLSGQPGCGKTLLAKAIAGEADVPFFSISGSDFVEMDGFEAHDQVIVIAATNRPDVLDPALTRPGRFDRQVAVPLPDLRGRRQILAVHARKVKIGADVDLERLARGTPMFSGADLAAIINEAAIIATMAEKDAIEMSDLEEARDKVRFGRANRSRKIEEEERVATAYHEAGHALLQVLLKDADPLHKVTIIPRGQAMGATFSLPEKDRYGYSRRHLLATMRVLCGGRIAEEKKTSDISSGASMDIRMATAYARTMVLQWGMSDRLGFVNYGGSDERDMFIPEKDYSPETAHVIDQEVRTLIDSAYADARQMIEQNWDKVVAISEALLAVETLSRDDVDRIMAGEPFQKPSVADLLKRELPKNPAAPSPGPGQQQPHEDLPPGALPSPA